MTNTTDNRNFQSGNSKYKSKKKNNSPGKFILALIILLAVGYYFLNPFIKSEGVDIDGPIIIEELIYETPSENIEEGGRTYVVSGHKIVLSFITDKLDTINGKDFDEIAEKINFTSSNFSDYTYQLNNGIIYPCDEEVILRWGNEIPNHDSDFENFKFELNSNLISIGSGNIVNKVKIVERDHFENFIKHEDSDCLTMVEIIEVTEPDPKNNCHFYVYTNHPNNLRNDSIIEADSTIESFLKLFG